jgi:hypothetical protein
MNRYDYAQGTYLEETSGLLGRGGRYTDGRAICADGVVRPLVKINATANTLIDVRPGKPTNVTAKVLIDGKLVKGYVTVESERGRKVKDGWTDDDPLIVKFVESDSGSQGVFGNGLLGWAMSKGESGKAEKWRREE